MHPRRIAIMLGVVVCIAGFLGTAWLGGRGPSERELSQRVAECRPTWTNYEEDIKAQIGAAPVAEWQGTPDHTVKDENRLKVAFSVSGPWALRAIGVPVLLHDPQGGIICSGAVSHEGPWLVYTFTLPESLSNASLPWVELKYPHGERRMTMGH